VYKNSKKELKTRIEIDDFGTNFTAKFVLVLSLLIETVVLIASSESAALKTIINISLFSYATLYLKPLYADYSRS